MTKARPQSLNRAASRVVEVLGRDDCVLIGGMAVAAHGQVRATKDVDFMTRLPIPEARARLTKAGYRPETRRGDPTENLPTFLRVTVEGVRVDVLPELVRLEWDRLAEVSLSARVAVKVVDVDSLIQLKLRAGGPQDLLDVAHLVWRHPDRLGYARQLAARHRVRDLLEIYLVNPRERRKLADTLSGTKHGRKTLRELAELLPTSPSKNRGRSR